MSDRNLNVVLVPRSAAHRATHPPGSKPSDKASASAIQPMWSNCSDGPAVRSSGTTLRWSAPDTPLARQLDDTKEQI
jgi:hypothetical protein